MPKDGTDEPIDPEKVRNAIADLRSRAVEKRRAAESITLEAAGLDYAANLMTELLEAEERRPRPYDTVPLAAVAEALSDAGEQAEEEPERAIPAPMRMVRKTPEPAAPDPEEAKLSAADRVLALLRGSDRALDFETIRTTLNMRFSTARRAVDQCVEAGRVVRYGPARGRGVSYWASQAGDAPAPPPEPQRAVPPSHTPGVGTPGRAEKAPAGATERDPRTLPGRIVLEALNDAGESGMQPTTLREETGLEPSPFRMVIDPMVEQKIIARLSLGGQVRYVLLDKGVTELKRLRDLSP